jgi:hypothetical protein
VRITTGPAEIRYDNTWGYRAGYGLCWANKFNPLNIIIIKFRKKLSLGGGVKEAQLLNLCIQAEGTDYHILYNRIMYAM